LALLRDDQIGLKAGATIKLPIAAVEVDYGSFLFIGPSILIFITLYLHIYVQQWYNCSNNEKKNFCVLKNDSQLVVFLCHFVYFGLAPAILLIFYVIARGKPDFTTFTGFWFGTTFGFMPFLFFSYRKMWRAWKASAVFFFVFLGFICYFFSVGFDLADHMPLRLKGADLKNQNMIKYNIKNMVAESANFKNCVFYQKDFGRSKASRANFDESNLYEAKLNDSDFGSASFKNAELSGALIIETILFNADLRNAKLKQACLYKAKLEGAILDHADLTGASLYGANLKVASLASSTLGNAEFSYADMGGVNLKHAESEKAAFIYANLKEAKLQSATLTNADFSYSDMSDANMDKADVAGAVFYKAKLFNTDLRKAINLKADQLNNACFDDTTKLPDDFDKTELFPFANCEE
jgi:uncharacterized protein YjbI with pentapeptide repeats